MENNEINLNEKDIITKFNQRDSTTFGEVYSLFFTELNHFASKLFRDTEIIAEDVVHDVFVSIWLSNRIIFNELSSIKSYIYISIRNRHRNYIQHQKSKKKYINTLSLDDSQFIAYIVEVEVFSLVNSATDLLNEECAQVVKEISEGWSIREIANKMGRPERTIYNKKAEAIAIIKQKMSRDKFLLVMNLLS